MVTLTKLVKNNTGYNSKTFIMLIGVGLTWITSLALVPLIYIAAINGLIIPWYGISTFYTSLTAFAGVLIWGKVKTDISSPPQEINETKEI